MGFYFRKSKSVGPFRLNFSKSGIGVSTGVKGARLSFGPRGTYVNVGKNGIYYRKKIGSSRNKSVRNTNVDQNRFSHLPSGHSASEEDDSIRFRNPHDNESLINETIRKGNNRYTILFLLWVVICATLAFYIKLRIIPVAIISKILLDWLFTVKLHYGLDEEAAEEWDIFCDELFELKYNKKLWMVESSSFIGNTKTNAGVSRNVTRSVAKIKRKPAWRKSLDFIVADVPKIEIQGLRYSILFLPSDIVVSRRGNAIAYPYSQIKIIDSTTRFVEHGKVEKDVYVTGYTHQFVNRDGSADLRYKNNPEIPVCRYGTLIISAGNNLRIELQTSNDETVKGITKAFRFYQDYYTSIEERGIREVSEQQPINNQKSSQETKIIRADEADSYMLDAFNKLKKIVTDTGERHLDLIKMALGCGVDMIEGVQYKDGGIVLYEAQERVDFRLDTLQKLFDEKIDKSYGYHFIFQAVSENRFIAHIKIGSFKKMPAELELSEQMQEALLASENYEIVLEKVYPKPRPKEETDEKVVSTQELHTETSNDSTYVDTTILIEETVASKDPFDELFTTDESDDVNSDNMTEHVKSEDSKMVDDLMDFFE